MWDVGLGKGSFGVNLGVMWGEFRVCDMWGPERRVRGKVDRARGARRVLL